MNLEYRDLDQDRDETRGKSRVAALDMERLRSSGRRPARRNQKISLFWQVFGGTILSIVALIILTAYSQLTSMQTDLRREMNQVEVDQVKKDEFSARLSVLWNSIKSLQDTSTSLLSLNEHAKIFDRNVDARIQNDEEQHKDLLRKVEELNQRLQSMAERLAALEAAQRVFKIEPDAGKPRAYGHIISPGSTTPESRP
jgi:hypothetical protein